MTLNGSLGQPLFIGLSRCRLSVQPDNLLLMPTFGQMKWETSRQLPNWPTMQSSCKENIDVHSGKFVLQRTSCVNVKVGTIEKVLRLYIPSHTGPSICLSIDFQAINLHHSLNVYTTTNIEFAEQCKIVILELIYFTFRNSIIVRSSLQDCWPVVLLPT